MENKTMGLPWQIYGSAVCCRLDDLLFRLLTGTFLGWIEEPFYMWQRRKKRRKK